jgi:hypothetical protein
MAQVVMGDAISPDFVMLAIKRLLAFTNAENFRVQRFASALAPHSVKQHMRLGNEPDAAQLPIFRSRFRISAYNDFASVKVYIWPCGLIGFALSATNERRPAQEFRAIS